MDVLEYSQKSYTKDPICNFANRMEMVIWLDLGIYTALNKFI